jgi:hypothetical protein
MKTGRQVSVIKEDFTGLLHLPNLTCHETRTEVDLKALRLKGNIRCVNPMVLCGARACKSCDHSPYLFLLTQLGNMYFGALSSTCLRPPHDCKRLSYLVELLTEF